MNFSPALPLILITFIVLVCCALQIWTLIEKRNSFFPTSLPTRNTIMRTILFQVYNYRQWIGVSVTIFLVAISCMRPFTLWKQTNQGKNSFSDKNMNIIFVMDSSPSMKVKDLGARHTRIELARQDALDIMNTYPYASFSLITYGTSARIDWPLSADNWSFSQRLRSLNAYDSATYTNMLITDPWAPTVFINGQTSYAAHREPQKANYVFFFTSGDPLSTIIDTPRHELDFSSIQAVSGGAAIEYGTERGGTILAFYSDDSPVYVEDNNQQTAVVGVNTSMTERISRELHVPFIRRAHEGSRVEWKLNPPPDIYNGDLSTVSTHRTEYYWIWSLAVLVLICAFGFDVWRHSSVLVQLTQRKKVGRAQN